MISASKDNDKIFFSDVVELNNEYKHQLRQWRNQDFVRERMVSQAIITKEQHLKFLSSLEKNKNKKVFICFYNDEPFGVLYYDYFPSGNNLEFGYYLISEEFLNSGLGAVLEYVLLNHAFYKLRVHKVIGRVISSNKKVLSLHSKFGFNIEGLLREHVKASNGYEDIYCLGIFLDTWQLYKPKIERAIHSIINLGNIGEIV